MIDIWPATTGSYWPPPETLDDAGLIALSNIDPSQLPTEDDILSG